MLEEGLSEQQRHCTLDSPSVLPAHPPLLFTPPLPAPHCQALSLDTEPGPLRPLHQPRHVLPGADLHGDKSVQALSVGCLNADGFPVRIIPRTAVQVRRGGRGASLSPPGSSGTGNTPKGRPSLSESLWGFLFHCFDLGFTADHPSQRGCGTSSNLGKLFLVISGLKTSVRVILSEMPFPAKPT